MAAVKTRIVDGAPSWCFETDRVRAAVTTQGGHLAPVEFRIGRRWVQPYSIAPWATEDTRKLPPLLRTLRGDFFCLPFGGNAQPWNGEQHPTHGETASRPWRFVSVRPTLSGCEFVARLRTKIRPGEVTKRLTLRQGESNIYSRHELRGFSGPMDFGHHAMLAFPEENGPGYINLSPWRRGAVCPQPFESPAQGGYYSLRAGASFRSLERVPLATGGFADLTQYPARAGFEDLVMLSARRQPGLAWTSVTFPEAGWLWIAVKDPRVLASTILWHSNGGRHYPPWNGRHRGVLGLEEVTSYFHFGLAESVAPNEFSRAGIPTFQPLRPDETLLVNYMMGVVPIPPRFDRVATVDFADDHLRIRSRSGIEVMHPFHRAFFSAAPANVRTAGK